MGASTKVQPSLFRFCHLRLAGGTDTSELRILLHPTCLWETAALTVLLANAPGSAGRRGPNPARLDDRAGLGSQSVPLDTFCNGAQVCEPQCCGRQTGGGAASPPSDRRLSGASRCRTLGTQWGEQDASLCRSFSWEWGQEQWQPSAH